MGKLQLKNNKNFEDTIDGTPFAGFSKREINDYFTRNISFRIQISNALLQLNF